MMVPEVQLRTAVKPQRIPVGFAVGLCPFAMCAIVEVHVQNPTPIAASFPYQITVAPAASHATRDSR
jgi:hypothetical protein